jgi:response regulator RpfG family c-di-GMP phosphodiesterase
MNKLQPWILLIDDDEDDLELFSSGLEMKGVKVKAFDSSTKALFYLTLREGDMELPSLIILDYNMPKRMVSGCCGKLKTIRALKISLLSCIPPACPEFLKPNY